MSTETSTETTTPVARSRSWKWLLALPLAAALSVPAVHAFAHPGGPGGPEAGMFGHFGGGRRMGKLLDAAGASEQQRTQIKNAWSTLRPQFQALRQDQTKLHEELRKALTAPTIDTAAVERLRQEGLKLADRTSALVTKGIVQSAQVLTPEQRQKIAAQMEQHRGEMEKHFRGE
jgi:protein CpxP